MMCADPLTTSWDVSTPRAIERVDLLEQHAEVDDDAVADDRACSPASGCPTAAGAARTSRSPTTMVWPALLPPLNLTTASTRLPSRSVALPLPSSPHWAPTRTIAGNCPPRLVDAPCEARRSAEPGLSRGRATTIVAPCLTPTRIAPRSPWTRPSSPPSGTTCSPTCRCRRRRRCIPARCSRSARTISPRCSRWISSCRRSPADRYIDIPGAVLDVYRLWRPSPLYRAHRLEKALDTPAHIYYKYEGVSPAGSHKPNTAVPQAYYNAAGRHPAADHRDRRRPVGHRAGLRVRAVRARMRGLAGAGVLRPEALPPDHDGGLRRRPCTRRPPT